MNIACGSCSAKYAVPNEKIRGRKVRIKCKKCGSPIIVDGTVIAPDAAAEKPSPAATSAGPRKVAKKTMLGGMGAPIVQGPAKAAEKATAEPATKQTADQPPGKRAVKKTVLGGLSPAPGAAPSPASSPAPTSGSLSTGATKGTLLGGMSPAAGSAPGPPPAAEEEPWTVAVTEEDQRDVSTDEVVDLYAAGTIDAETFVWKEGMDDWLTPFEIPEIASALRKRGIEPPKAETAPATASPIGAPPSSGGAWHEPGSWDAPDPGTSDGGVGFDDVTVAMEAPDAELLARAGASEAAAARAEREEPAAPIPGDDRPQPPTTDDDEEATVAMMSPLSSPQPDVASDAGSPPAAGPAKLPFELDIPPQSSPGADAPAADASPPRPAAARREDSRARVGVDLFADVDPAPPPASSGSTSAEHRFTGERNESSVLFSLESLAKMQEADAKQEAKKEDAEFLLAPSSNETVEDAPSSLAKLEGGGLFAAALAAPDVTAPAAEPPPAPDIESGSRTAVSEVKKSRGGWAVLLVALVVLGVGGAAYAAFNWPDGGGTSGPASATPTPEAPKAETHEPAPPPPASAEETKTEETKTEEAKTEEAKTEEAGKVEEKKTEEKKTEEKKTEEKKTEEKKTEDTEEEKAEETPELPPFNKSAAAAALGSAAGSAAGCKKPDGPTGRGRATVTFMPSGRATNAVITGDFAGTAVGGCVARIFRGARVPPFSGDPVTVAKSFSIQ